MTRGQAATPATAATSQAQETSVLAQHTQASLLHSVQALQAMQAAQSAARSGSTGLNNISTLPTVPDGLAQGGLVPDSGLASPGVANPVTTWVNAKTPVQTASQGQATVTVQQTGQQALLRWNSFNIGHNTTLAFDQSLGGANAGQWVAINQVAPNIAPSQILGSMAAQGQVYVLNQNGILFGGKSQVNVGALVASSLPINNNNNSPNNSLVGRGLLNNPDFQFLFSQIDIPAGSVTDAFQPQENSPAPTGGVIAQSDSSGNVSIVKPNSQDGDVVVLLGAQLTSADTAEHVGGKIALIGPNVVNAGSINTPDGQTILAAGLQVGLLAHNSADASLRGLDVSVGAVSDPSYASGATGVAGNASNDGLIEIPRADLTMVGKSVNQNGVVDSSTSVSLNGRVDLLANYDAVPLINNGGNFNGTSGFYPTASGAVTFGPNSLTQILPELASSDTIVGAQLALSSLVNVEANTIHFSTNAELLAPGAAVPYPYASGSTTPTIFAYDENNGAALSSGVSLGAGNWLEQTNFSYALTFAYGEGGQVYFDPGSSIDVSGSQNVSASVTENIVTAQLLGTELANSPLQRNGPLRGASVQIDLREVGVNNGTDWIGTPLADVSGYVGLVAHTVGELTVAGGTVGISAGDSVVMQAGSNINVSGGYINYQGGNIQTTRVIQRGQIIDIAQANPDFPVEGIYDGYTETSTKWNVSETFQNRLLGGSHYQAGYIQGADAGSIAITAPAMALDGNFFGNTVAGIQQTTTVAQLTKTYGSANFLPTVLAVEGVPTYGALTLSFQANEAQDNLYESISPTPPQITFTPDSSLSAAGAFGSTLSAARVAEVDLSPDLFGSEGFGSLTLNNGDGDILVPANVHLQGPLGGSLTLSAANIDIEGSITVPSGQLSFTAYDFSPFNNTTLVANPSYDPTRGQFTLGADASLDVAGQVIDNRETAPSPGTLPSLTSGGSVKINSSNVDLVAGATARTAIDVSGGLEVVEKGATSSVTYGNAGSIDIEAGQAAGHSSILGGQLLWDPELTKLVGYSGATGGSLTVKVPLIQIGGSSLLNGDTVTSGNTLWLNQTDASGNLLQPDFFSQGGFASFTLKSIGGQQLDSNGNFTGEYLPGTLIAPDTLIAPQALTLVAKTDGANIQVETEQLPVGQRAPVSLSFSVSGASDPFSNVGFPIARGDFIMDEGAVIQTDPQTNAANGVTIKATTVTVLGSIIAPGGSISIAGAGSSIGLLLNQSEATPTLYLGPESLLSTAGATVLTANNLGLRTGSVLSGGNISLDGNIFAQAGAVLDVSGASGVLDVTKASVENATVTQPLASTYVSTRVDSNGGSITFKGEQGMVTDATLLGFAGGPSAQGGTVTVSSGIYPQKVVNPLDPTLVVTQASQPDYASGYLKITGSGDGDTSHVIGNTGNVIGNTVLDSYGINALDGDNIQETGYFVANNFDSGGFDALVLKGTVKFSGPVSITANRSLTVGDGGVILADAAVNLRAPYVALGQPYQAPQANSVVNANLSTVFTIGSDADPFSPSYGTGSLNVASNFIDLGNLSLQGVGSASLTAANGDIRGYGTVDIAGAISLTAGQIYPTTESTFTIAAYDYNGLTGNSSITIAGSGNQQLPLSAGGVLNLYASNIFQGGVLRAPVGTINLGSGIFGATPIDPITGSGLPNLVATSPVPVTQNLTLANGSTTSVSAVDPQTGKAMTLPYGVNTNGVEWDDPVGNNITLLGNTVVGSGQNGIPDKAINVSGINIDDQSGSTIDISGGGDLVSYNFVSGTGGTNDILGSTNSYAILPGYQSAVAPYYPSSDYSNSGLLVGEKIYLNASNGLPAGTYTLLPARYALLPGAFLVTPTAGKPYTTAIAEATGFSIVSGYMSNGFDHLTSAPTQSLFKISPPSVVAAAAQYNLAYASTYLSQSALASSITVPLLPLDAGHLIVAATSQLSVQGSVNSRAPAGGLGGLVDIATTSNILIYGPQTNLSNVPSTTLALDSSGLSGFGAGSLLIGGYRERVDGAYDVTVTTNELTVDNAGAGVTVGGQTLDGLSAPDVILASNQNLNLDSGATIEQSPVSSTPPATSLVFTGDGALLRVSSNGSDSIIRSGPNPSDPTNPTLEIGAGARVSGFNEGVAANITLDSSSAIKLDSSAVLKANTVNLDSGQIVVELGTPDPATIPSSNAFILSGLALNNLQSSVQDLSLLSYSTLDIYGSGTIGGNAVSGKYPVASLTLHASEIRGYSDDQGGRAVTINAQDVNLDNSSGGTSLGATTGANGSLTINAGTINLGTNQVNIDQYSNVNLNASGGILLLGETKASSAAGANTSASTVGQGSLIVAGNLTLNTPLIAADTFSASQAAPSQVITAQGNLIINGVGTLSQPASEGLGASLSLTGQSVIDTTNIEMPSGSVTVHAITGDLTIGGVINTAGTSQSFNTLTQYSSGGKISLASDQGSVNLSPGSNLQVQAPTAGGNAGQLSVSAPNGALVFAGATISGAGGAGGQNGTFSLDAGSLASLDDLDSVLNTGGFTLSRTIRARTGDLTIDGVVTAQTFNLSADTGSILVNGKIDASGATGGSIDISASGNVTLASGSVLTVAGQNFSDAGEGGSVTLEAGADTNGVAGSGYVNIGSGSTIDLSVASYNPGSAALGDRNGTLLIRAPQIAGNTDLQVDPINGNIIFDGSNASAPANIVIAGNQIFAPSNGTINSALEASVKANGNTFAGNTAAILGRLYGSNSNSATLSALTLVEPAAEIINPTGNLTLASSWDLLTYRYGPNVNPLVAGSGTPGIITLRAAGDVVFNFGASLTDGFNTANTTYFRTSNHIWSAPLLPAGDLSSSYQITAGADLSAADPNTVLSTSALQNLGFDGSVLVGQNSPSLPSSAANRTTVLQTYFQTIRTGTGNITINAGGDVLLLNNLATIYTAGTQAPVLAGFTLPTFSTATNKLTTYGAQYSLEGGNVNIFAQGNIAHETASGDLDSSLELPTSWLYRQGAVDPTTGQFLANAGTKGYQTSWWVDFSNFFEGVGALGGGNVTLTAGLSVNNVDAVAPTNARMPGTTPNAANLVEFGGGDVTVKAGQNINGGVYYVECGQGTLVAGGQIITNETRTTTSYNPAGVFLTDPTDYPSAAEPITWLPTTLFLGQGSFDVSAGGDLELGPVANVFLMPQGIFNSNANLSYFSTYASTDSVNVSSISGQVTLKDNPTSEDGSLYQWYENLFVSTSNAVSVSEPWLKSAETNASGFTTVTALMPPTLNVTSFSSDINVIGSLTLLPSADGNITLVAAGSLNGFTANDATPNGDLAVILDYSPSTIDLSDADPPKIPGVASPLSSPNLTRSGVLNNVNALFQESGATQDVSLQTQQTLHDGTLLHAGDPNPVDLFAETGNISGFTLYSPKVTQVVAGQDITDIGLYIQNTSASDVSVVSAGNDIVAYDDSSPLRLSADQISGLADNSGDIQIDGPGTLEVLAGRNLDLGESTGSTPTDGTGVGISSVGNARNPALPFAGANVVVAAGLGGSSTGLDASKLDLPAFEAQFLTPGLGQSSRYLPDLGTLMGLPAGDSDQQIVDAFASLPADNQADLALDIFYDVLRDSGRDHNDPTSPNAGTYNEGFAAIHTLFPGAQSGGAWPSAGNITLTSRELKTTNGGDINILAPGGQLTVGIDLGDKQPQDQGILTESGGNISIFTNNDVAVGTSRIFTLSGGNVIIWSSVGDIAAGNSSKTVQSAPPTRVLIDPQSGDVQTDLAGLATGGGIGVLETVVGAKASDVDLIAPNGTVDAGDAGIRASGNINIAAARVLNAGNIQAGGKTTGTPTSSAPNIAGISAASSAGNAVSNSSSAETRPPTTATAPPQENPPSIISVEVLGYGGDDSDN